MDLKNSDDIDALATIHAQRKSSKIEREVFTDMFGLCGEELLRLARIGLEQELRSEEEETENHLEG